MIRDFFAMQVVNLPPWQFPQPDRPTSMDHNQGGNVASVEVHLKRHIGGSIAFRSAPGISISGGCMSSICPVESRIIF